MGCLRWKMTVDDWKKEISKSSKALKTCQEIIDKSKNLNIEETEILDFLDESEIYGDLVIDFWQICEKNPEKVMLLIFGMKKFYDPKNLTTFILKKDYSFFEAIFNFSSRKIKA